MYKSFRTLILLLAFVLSPPVKGLRSADHPLPEFYGVYALGSGNLFELEESEKGIPDLPPDVRFLLYDKNVGEVAKGVRIARLQFVRNIIVGNTVKPQMKWELRDIEDTLVELRQKPVEGQPEMIYMVPRDLLMTGSYSVMTSMTFGEGIMQNRERRTLGYFFVNGMEFLLVDVQKTEQCVDLVYSDGLARTMGEKPNKVIPCASPEDKAKALVENIGKFIEMKQFGEADQLLNKFDREYPDPSKVGLFGAWERSLADHRRILDQELGRVDNAIQNDTFVLEGNVTQKSEIQGSGGFWGFELKSDDGSKYVFACNASNRLYFKLKESNIDTSEGYEQLKNVNDRVKLYIPNSQKDYVMGECKNQGCNGTCPIAIVMLPSTSKRVETPTQAITPQPATAQNGETVQFLLDKLIGTATVKVGAYVFTDPATQLKGRQIESATTVEIKGFIRTEDNTVSALQAVLPGQATPLYIFIDDVTDFKQANEIGAYLQILLTSSVFNKNGKVGSKETMKSLDAYLGNYPQAQFAPDAMLDYLLCLQWLFRNDKSASKDAVVRLAEIYVDKAKQRFPGAPQTKRCESVAFGMKNSWTDKEIQKASSGENTFVILRETHGKDGNKTGQFAVQPGWISKRGEIQKLKISDHLKVPSAIYLGGNKDLKAATSSEPQKVSVDCMEYGLKTIQGQGMSKPFASSEPLPSAFDYSGQNVAEFGEAAVQKAVAVAKAKGQQMGVSITSAKGRIVEAVDLEKDGVPEFGVDVELKMAKPKVYEVIGEVSSLHGLVWLRVKSLELIDVLFNGFEASGGTPSAYQCDGVADFDGDGVAEIAQHSVWGEAGLSLEIYKLKNNKLEKVFESEAIGGC